MRKGQMFYAPQFGTTILVRRVAADRSWADITVHPKDSNELAWNKRQPLNHGKFPYEVEELDPKTIR